MDESRLTTLIYEAYLDDNAVSAFINQMYVY
jgi:hypothetical protein